MFQCEKEVAKLSVGATHGATEIQSKEDLVRRMCIVEPVVFLVKLYIIFYYYYFIFALQGLLQCGVIWTSRTAKDCIKPFKPTPKQKNKLAPKIVSKTTHASVYSNIFSSIKLFLDHENFRIKDHVLHLRIQSYKS